MHLVGFLLTLISYSKLSPCMAVILTHSCNKQHFKNLSLAATYISYSLQMSLLHRVLFSHLPHTCNWKWKLNKRHVLITSCGNSTPSLIHAFRISTFLNFLELMYAAIQERVCGLVICVGMILLAINNLVNGTKNYTCGVEINP